MLTPAGFLAYAFAHTLFYVVLSLVYGALRSLRAKVVAPVVACMGALAWVRLNGC